MSATSQRGSSQVERDISGWAVGGIAFAGTVMVMVGAFQIIEGIVAIANDNFYVALHNYTFNLDVTAWGWIHLIMGVILLVTGFGLFARSTWAGVVGIVVCTLSAVSNFFFLPHYPIWAVTVIALNVWIIWALTRPGAINT
jgi:hypothetical protein